MLFLLNNSVTLEPRLGISYKFLNGNSLSLAYGNHSLIEPLPVYFYRYETEAGETHKPNIELKPSRSNHLVIAYNRILAKSLRMSAEIYYQQLYNIPVEPNGIYSVLNFKQEYKISDSLSNEGSGVNKGFDITIEKFLDKNYYFLVTGSFIDSDYTAGDNNTYNTRWDYGYVFNLLGGREFYMGPNGDKILGINGRIVFQGGERTHPVDLDKSRLAQRVIYDDSKAWESRYPSTYFIDFTTTLRINKARYSSVWGIQIKNLLFENSIFYHEFNDETQKVEVDGEGFIFPNISYKIEF